MAWHSVNAYNEGDELSIDICAQEIAAFPAVDGTLPQQAALKQFLTRWTLDYSAPGGYSTETLSDTVCEYPRIDERYTGEPYRYAYVACAGGPGTGDPFHRAIGRFDHATRQMSTCHLGRHCAISEPIFVPRSMTSPEGDGFLLATVYDEARNAGHLAIFDAEHLDRGPVARAMLDHRIPMGFHGNWKNDGL